jgi:hypothetical protein
MNAEKNERKRREKKREKKRQRPDRVGAGAVHRGKNTARQSRNQTCADHMPAGITTESNISARLATNLRISSTEGTERRTQRSQRKTRKKRLE